MKGDQAPQAQQPKSPTVCLSLSRSLSLPLFRSNNLSSCRPLGVIRQAYSNRFHTLLFNAILSGNREPGLLTLAPTATIMHSSPFIRSHPYALIRYEGTAQWHGLRQLRSNSFETRLPKVGSLKCCTIIKGYRAWRGSNGHGLQLLRRGGRMVLLPLQTLGPGHHNLLTSQNLFQHRSTLDCKACCTIAIKGAKVWLSPTAVSCGCVG